MPPFPLSLNFIDYFIGCLNDDYNYGGDNIDRFYKDGILEKDSLVPERVLEWKLEVIDSSFGHISTLLKSLILNSLDDTELYDEIDILMEKEKEERDEKVPCGECGADKDTPCDEATCPFRIRNRENKKSNQPVQEQ